jgi:hypothetical protein
MKTFWISILTIVTMVLCGLGCEQMDTVPTEPSGDRTPALGSGGSIGDLHNDFLRRIHQQERISTDPIAAAHAAANEMASEYALAPLTREDVEAAIAWGEDSARKEPLDLLAECLTPEELEWFLQFAEYAAPHIRTPEDVEVRYQEFRTSEPLPRANRVQKSHAIPMGVSSCVERSGGATNAAADLETSRLACLMDVMIASGRYWAEYHKGQALTYELAEHRPGALVHEGDPPAAGDLLEYSDPDDTGLLKRLLRFGTYVLVDASTGALVSAGGGGPILGAVLGGLASYGADHLIFGCNGGDADGGK